MALQTPLPPRSCLSRSTDADFRRGWMENADEQLERYSRLNDRMLDGCEAAYEAIATEWHADSPDFDKFVESGALDAQLALLLKESLAKYTAAGRRPIIELGRVNSQVRFLEAAMVLVGGSLACWLTC